MPVSIRYFSVAFIRLTSSRARSTGGALGSSSGGESSSSEDAALLALEVPRTPALAPVAVVGVAVLSRRVRASAARCREGARGIGCGKRRVPPPSAAERATPLLALLVGPFMYCLIKLESPGHPPSQHCESFTFYLGVQNQV